MAGGHVSSYFYKSFFDLWNAGTAYNLRRSYRFLCAQPNGSLHRFTLNNNDYSRSSGIKDDFIALAHTYPTYDLWITGHSLGGAMASLAASYIGFNQLFPVSQIKMISLGQPRTGDTAYADAFDQLVRNLLYWMAFLYILLISRPNGNYRVYCIGQPGVVRLLNCSTCIHAFLRKCMRIAVVNRE